MGRGWWRILPAIASIAALMLPTVDAGAATADLSAVRAERARIQERLDGAAARMGALEEEVAAITDEQDRLERDVEQLRAEVAATSDRVAARVHQLYKHGGAHPVIALLAGADPTDAVERAELMQRVVAADERDAEAATASRIQLEAVVGRIEEQRAALDDRREELRRLADELADDLEAAQALEARLEAEERARREAEARRREAERLARERAAREARRAAPAPAAPARDDAPAPAPAPAPPAAPPSGGSAPAPGGKACPMARPHSFTDTWGAPRSGGRRHKGTDILGPRGQSVFAITSGVWDVRSYGRSAGNWGMLRGDDGTTYYYMHLERHVAGDGQRVAAGELIATNGDTGNARGTTPHVHFEAHPGGGGAVNPYPLLRQVCG